MSYYVTVGGAVSTELTQLLRVVEAHLNGHELHAQAQTNIPISTSAPCRVGDFCDDNGKAGHQPPVSAIVAASFIAGFAVGYFVGKKSAPKASS